VGLIGYLGKVEENIEFADGSQRCEAFSSSRTLTTERKSTPKTEFNKNKTQNPNQIGNFIQNSKTPKPRSAVLKRVGGTSGKSVAKSVNELCENVNVTVLQHASVQPRDYVDYKTSDQNRNSVPRVIVVTPKKLLQTVSRGYDRLKHFSS